MAHYVLAPRAPDGRVSGGLFTQQRLAEAIGAQRLYYQAGRGARKSVSRAIEGCEASDVIVFGFGSHAAEVLPALAGRRAVYWANSIGWSFVIPPGLPVLSASRFTLGHWGERAPQSPLYYLPNVVEERFCLPAVEQRRTDVLVQRRKSSCYVLQELVPALRSAGLRVDVLDTVPDLAAAFQGARVYVYDSVQHWRRSGLSEGFGLPPLEAAASGCHVFSSLNAGLADFVDPGHGWSQVGVFGVEEDVRRIRRAVAEHQPSHHRGVVDEHRAVRVAARWATVLAELEDYWTATAGQVPAAARLEPFAGHSHKKPSTFTRVRAKVRSRSSG